MTALHRYTWCNAEVLRHQAVPLMVYHHLPGGQQACQAADLLHTDCHAAILQRGAAGHHCGRRWRRLWWPAAQHTSRYRRALLETWDNAVAHRLW